MPASRIGAVPGKLYPAGPSGANGLRTFCVFSSFSCTYISMVIAVELCPRYFETALIDAPSRMDNVAKLCLIQ